MFKHREMLFGQDLLDDENPCFFLILNVNNNSIFLLKFIEGILCLIFYYLLLS